MDCTTVVIGRAESLQIKKDDFAAGDRHVFVGGVCCESTNAIVNGRGCGRVINIDKVIRCVVRIKRYAEQATFTIEVDVECREWCG